MTRLDEVLGRLEKLLTEVEALDEPTRVRVFELLDGIDHMHRMALGRLPEVIGPEGVERLRRADPALAWLLDAYGIGVDEAAAAEEALEEVRPYIQSHGGEVEVLGAAEGIVRLKLSGSCSGCTASAITLKEGIEKALRERFAGFVAIDVEEDHEAEAHPPPGPTLLQLEDRLS